MSASRHKIVMMAALIGCAVGSTPLARAEWWSHKPADFEECADLAEKAATKDAKSAALAECNAKFAGRRKPGGGYTYYDFMQNRSFDIAGPNPTPEEQKQIDEQYTAYLEKQRRSRIVAAFAARQQQLQQHASLKSEAEKAPPNTASIARPRAAATELRHVKPAGCPRDSFSCEWPRLSAGLDDLKKALFGPPSGKPRRTKQGLSG